MAAVLAEPEQVQQIPVDLLLESPTNPRKVFTGMDELVASVQAQGVLSPLMVRPRDGGTFEVCFGHRRLRAAKAAGLATVPALVRELGDEQLIAAQLIENLQRKDITELEEADAYAALIAKGYTGDRIAAETGKTKATVYARAKLAALGKPGRQALETGKLDASTALLIARLPQKLQRDAVLKLLDETYGLETFRERRDFLYEEVFHKLDEAQWPLADAELVPEAGACTTCEKSSLGNSELKGAQLEVCTDTGCWDKKHRALYQLKLNNAKKLGGRAMAPEEQEQAFPWDWRPQHDDSKFRLLEFTLTNNAKTGPKTLRQVAEEHGLEVKPLVVDRNGRILELLPREEADAIAAVAGVKPPKETDWNARAAKQEVKRKEKEAARAVELERIYSAVRASRGPLPRFVLEQLVEERWYLIPPKLRGTEPLANLGDAELVALATVARVAWASSNSPQALSEAVARLVPVDEPTPAPKASSPGKKSPTPTRSSKAKPRKPAKKAKKAKAKKRGRR